LLFAMLATLHAAGRDKSNIIVILTDDRGWANLAAQGVTRTFARQTPTNLADYGNHIYLTVTPFFLM
jgi:hypothetical protein